MKKQAIATLALLMTVVVVWAQVVVKGTVKSTEGTPLTGASVYFQNTFKGVQTDENGAFAFSSVASGEHRLVVSFIGFESLERVISVGATDLNLDFELEKSTFLTNEIVVLATRATDKTPTTFSDLNKNELEANNLGQDAPYLMQFTPSAVVTSDAGTGIGYTGIRIRGSDATRINVTINGIPLNDAESQGVFWVNMPDFVASVDNVQIQRGVGTSTNGAGAFGATINLLTTRQNAEPFVELNTSAGSFQTLKSTIRAGSGLIGDHFSIEGRYSNIQSDGYIDRASADLNAYFLTASYYGKNNTLTFNTFHGKEVTYQAWWGVPGYLLDSLRTFNPAGTEKDPPHDNEVDDYQQTHYQLLYAHNWSNWTLNLAGHYTAGAGFYEEYKAAQDPNFYNLTANGAVTEGVSQTDLIRRRWLDNDYLGATYSLTYEAAKWRATLSGAGSRYWGVHFGETIFADSALSNETLANAPIRYYEGKGVKDDFNVFAKINYQLSKKINLFADLQYRYVWHDITGIDTDKRDVTQAVKFHFFNPKIGLTYEQNRRSAWYASYAKASREPNRSDLVDAPTSLRPRPEILHDFELGYRFKGAQGVFSANIYSMFYNDQLVLTGQINDVGAPIKVNVDESYRLGLELDGVFELSNWLNARLNLTFSRNRIKNFVEYVDDWSNGGQITIEHGETEIAFSPAMVGSGELVANVLANSPLQEHHRLEFALMSKYVGKQFFDNTSLETAVLPAYWVQDARLSYGFKKGRIKNLRLTLAVRNIFDALYESNAWIYRYFDGVSVEQFDGFYPQAGRNYMVGLDLRF